MPLFLFSASNKTVFELFELDEGVGVRVAPRGGFSACPCNRGAFQAGWSEVLVSRLLRIGPPTSGSSVVLDKGVDANKGSSAKTATGNDTCVHILGEVGEAAKK